MCMHIKCIYNFYIQCEVQFKWINELLWSYYVIFKQAYIKIVTRIKQSNYKYLQIWFHEYKKKL